MSNARAALTVHSPRLGVLTSLLLILFCLFKFERYQSSQLADATVSQQVCEQVAKVLPCYNIPRLIDAAYAHEVPVYAPEGDAPQRKARFKCMEREFAAAVTLRLKVLKTEALTFEQSTGFCRISRMLPGFSDDPSDTFSS